MFIQKFDTIVAEGVCFLTNFLEDYAFLSVTSFFSFVWVMCWPPVLWLTWSFASLSFVQESELAASAYMLVAAFYFFICFHALVALRERGEFWKQGLNTNSTLEVRMLFLVTAFGSGVCSFFSGPMLMLPQAASFLLQGLAEYLLLIESDAPQGA